MRLLPKLAIAVLVLGGVGAAGFWFLTRPVRLDPTVVAGLAPGDASRGERMFWAGGCTSCHAPPKSEGEAQLQLAGGVELKTPFGTFVAPNISQTCWLQSTMPRLRDSTSPTGAMLKARR